jgi:small subunit ribosomal protein S4
VGRNTAASCRICRRERLKLFLKGDRCYSDKCAFERRSFPPGQHGQARGRKPSDYFIQLREKQKVKRMYGMYETQFLNTFREADRQKGVTGENLLRLLERRLDNVVYRAGFASSRNQARQLVRHNHVRVNGRKVDIPSFKVKVGDEISIKEKSRNLALVTESLEAVARRGVPGWMELDPQACKAVIKSMPERDQITIPIQEQLIVELYSK